jgi:hypothetical protein
MKRLALPALLLLLVVPGAARAAACSPLNCAPSQFLFAHGTLLGVRSAVDKPLRVIDLRTGATRWPLPAGIVTGDTLVSQSASLLTWYDAATGARERDIPVQLDGAFQLVGTSQDAKRAVLARTGTRSTTFAILGQRSRQLVRLGAGNWQFDALNGPNLLLIQTLKNGYEVRLFSLLTSKLRPQPLKDQDEDALIQGAPLARASSPNGRYLFTLYVNGQGHAMIHELDTLAAFAYCIDLPGSGDYNSAITWAMVPSRDNSTVWAVSVGYGRLVAVDVAAHVVRERARFYSIPWTANAGVAALAPNGKSLVISDAQHTWFASLPKLRVRRGPNHVAVAVAFAPDGSRVWGVGQRSRVFSLRVNG